MPIFYHPPQPFVGGNQPLEGRQLTPNSVDLPPFSNYRRVATIAAILSLWSPAPLYLWQHGITPENPVVASDMVPVSSVIKQALAYGAWIPEQQPQQRRVLAVQPLVVVDPSYVRDISLIQIAWQTSYWPQQRRVLAVPAADVVDSVLFVRPLIEARAWTVEYRQPQYLFQHVATPESVAAEVESKQPFVRDISGITAAWQTSYWPQQRRPFQIVSVDEPPGYPQITEFFGSGEFLMPPRAPKFAHASVVVPDPFLLKRLDLSTAWQVPYASPQMPVKLVHPAPTKEPFVRPFVELRAWQITPDWPAQRRPLYTAEYVAFPALKQQDLSTAWQSVVYLQQKRRFYTAELVVAQDAVPFKRQVLDLTAWTTAQLPQLPRKFVPAVPTKEPYVREVLPLRAWNIIPPIQQRITKLVQPFVAVTGDQPIGLRRIIPVVQAPFVLPQRRFLPPELLHVVVDEPPGYPQITGFFSSPELVRPQRRPLIASFAISEVPAVVNNPPFDARRLARLQERTAFLPPNPAIVTLRHVIQPFVVEIVNDPTPFSRGWTRDVYRAWLELPDRLPYDLKAPNFVQAAGRRYIYLPPATTPVPRRYWFYVIDSRPMRVVATNGAYIRDGLNTCPVEGYIESTDIGSSLLLSCNKTGEWAVMAKNGIWTLSV